MNLDHEQAKKQAGPNVDGYVFGHLWKYVRAQLQGHRNADVHEVRVLMSLSTLEPVKLFLESSLRIQAIYRMFGRFQKSAFAKCSGSFMREPRA